MTSSHATAAPRPARWLGSADGRTDGGLAAPGGTAGARGGRGPDGGTDGWGWPWLAGPDCRTAGAGGEERSRQRAPRAGSARTAAEGDFQPSAAAGLASAGCTPWVQILTQAWPVRKRPLGEGRPLGHSAPACLLMMLRPLLHVPSLRMVTTPADFRQVRASSDQKVLARSQGPETGVVYYVCKDVCQTRRMFHVSQTPEWFRNLFFT